MAGEEVRAWAEKVNIPTYPVGQPDKNPMFLEKRVYQGSSGVVYPHPVIDRVFDEEQDRLYTAVFLENRHLKIMILPEIGGRVQMALDKTNGYHFVYYNRVIKPALVGLAGPWISGGIEFNWPQHHRPSTFDPVDWLIESHPDGSRTIWCAEIERMFRTRGMHGFTLYPERAYLAVDVQLYKCTGEPQTFLWWANPAVHVHEEYQSVFPPDVHAVMDHGKRDVSTFPIATGTYYKVNYAPGTDISRYTNIPVPTSYMAYHSDFDFIGDYDYRARAGMMHVANHHIVPGKKQWIWGCGDFGRAWDRQLTDEDGPYIELMCGAYTDNQPDFSWIQPGEEKRFRQIFMPYKWIGPAKNASQEAVLNLEVAGGQANLGVYVTRPRTVQVRLAQHNDLVDGANTNGVLYEKIVELSPETALVDTVTLPPKGSAADLTLTVLDGSEALLSYKPLPEREVPVPAPAQPAPPPHEMASNDELYLMGLHLEQYHHAPYPPEPYYEEALQRDPGDSRCSNALGRLFYRRGRFAEAEAFFRRAINRLVERNPNPYDGEPYYNLGLALKMQARYAEAYDAFYKAVWNTAWQAPAYFELASLACRAGRLEEALDLVRQALERNTRHHQARHLKIALLCHLGQAGAGRAEVAAGLELDAMAYGAMWERYLLDGDAAFAALVRGNAHTYVEIALDYVHIGLLRDAAGVLEQIPQPDALVRYTLGWVYHQSGEHTRARQAFLEAVQMPPDYGFPNRLEDVLVLETAMQVNPADARAPYYLGNFWYAHRRYAEAIGCWEKACALDPSFPTAHCNLGLAYMNQLGDTQRALEQFETAFALDPRDGRVFYELDQLYRRCNHSPQERLERLEQHTGLVAQRDDLSIEYVTLLNLVGRPEQAYQALMQRTFHSWEGGEGKTTGQYVISLVEMARRLIRHGAYGEAIQRLEQAQVYPPGLGEGKLYGAQENHIHYYLGLAYVRSGDEQRSRSSFLRAAAGMSEPASALYYNDQPPDLIFYQGLAQRALGHETDAQAIFRKLVDYGSTHLDDEVRLDYFAVSLPDFLVFNDDLKRRNRLHCLYMMGLGYLGLGETTAAAELFTQVLVMDASHLGAVLHNYLLVDAD